MNSSSLSIESTVHEQRRSNDNITISVIIPAYNSATYLSDCIHSVLRQSIRDIELILIDDASHDSTVEMACSILGTSDIDYQILIKPRNRGVSHSRNVGMRAARGSYLFFLDSDDLISEQALEILLNGYQKDCLPVLPVVRFTDINKLPKTTQVNDTSPYASYKMICEFDHGYAWGLLVEKSLVLANGLFFDETLSYREDNAWLASYLPYFPAVHRVSEALYAYRITPHSLSYSDPVEGTIRACRSVNHLADKITDGDLAPFLSIRRTLYRASFGEAIHAEKVSRLDQLKAITLDVPLQRVLNCSLPWPQKITEAIFTLFQSLEFPIYRYLSTPLLTLKQHIGKRLPPPDKQ